MSTKTIVNLTSATGLDGRELVEIAKPTGPDPVSTYSSNKVTTGQIANLFISANIPAAIEFLIDGAGANISSRVWGYMTVPFDATVTGASLLADQTGSIIVNIWRCTYDEFDAGSTHPVAADSITGGDPPTITTATKATATIDNWDTDLAEGDVLAFQVPASATAITRVTLSIELTRVID